MSFLYRAKYNCESNSFVLPETIREDAITKEFFFAKALYYTLKEYKGEGGLESGFLEFYIAYHSDIEFYQRNKEKAFCQYVHLRSKRDVREKKMNGDFLLEDNFTPIKISNSIISEKIRMLPIIHTTSLDLFDEKQELDKYYKVPRFIKIIDSNIWNLYVPVLDNFNKILKEQIGNIAKYQDYYKLKISIESADFQARVAYNSYLSGGDHSDNVSPFLFHSETRMKDFLEEKAKSKASSLPQKKVEWRALLIDDHSLVGLVDIEGNERKTKREIIDNRLLELRKESGREDLFFQIEETTTIDDAKEKILSKRYDIIFLDYLLGEKGDERQYGYRLLTDIRDNLKGKNGEEEQKKWKAAKGIYGRFWFFNISSFSHAIEERLREQGLAHFTSDWNFARGASPVITPELFKYELFRFLLHQIETISRIPFFDKDISVEEIAKNKEDEKLAPNSHRILTILDLLEVIYCYGNPRENAVKYFNSVLTIKANYKILKGDYYYVQKEDEEIRDRKKKTLEEQEAHGSLLVQSLFPDLKNYDNAFWEHLMHLVYVTAFGTIRQWPEMWEEFLFIKDYLLKSGADGKTVIKGIEKYIINLKQGNM